MNSFILSPVPVLVSRAPLLVRPLRSRMCAGFSSPAEDLGAQRIELAQVLIMASIKQFNA